MVLVVGVAVAAAVTLQPAATVDSPLPGSTSSVWNPAIALHLSDTVAITSPATLTIDGVSRSVQVVYPESGGHWEGDGCDSWWVADYDYTHGTVSYTPTALTDGSHSATLTASDSSGNRTDTPWSFVVQAPPKVVSKQPADGTAIKGTTPAISAVLDDNGTIATVTATVDGVAAGGTWTASTKTFALTPRTLADGSHTVTVKAVDAGGLSSTSSWQFSTINTSSTKFSSPLPARDSTVTVWNPTISVTCTDVAILKTGTLLIDGTAVTSKYVAATDGHTATISVVPTSLADGSHTVEARTTNDLGFSASYSWSFNVAAPPAVTSVIPADGGWATSLTPALSTTIAENSSIATVAVLIDGAPLAATYDATTKTAKANVATPLTDDAVHLASVIATDAGGYRTRRDWSFRTHATVPAFSNQTPAPGSNFLGTSTRVSVNVYDAMGLESTPSMTIDGKSVACQWNYVETGGYWDGDGCDSWWVAEYDYTRGTIWFDATGLTNSLHTVSVRSNNKIGGSASYDWSFGVASAPVLSVSSPASGSVVPTLAPTIAAKVTANAAIVSSAMLVDGVPVVSSYDSVTKTLRATPLQPLTDQVRHTVLASVTDAGGLSGSLSWTFTTDSTPPTHTLTPAAGARTDVSNPVVTAATSDSMGLASAGTMTIDGTSVPASFSYVDTGGQWVGTGCDSYYAPAYDYTRGTLSYQKTLTDGAHNVVASTKNLAGLATTSTWQFTVAEPPKLSTPIPAPDSWVNTRTPVISVKAVDNGTIATATVLVDGAIARATYSAATGLVTAVPPTPLYDDVPHTVLVTVTDSVGASASLSWKFTSHTGVVHLDSAAPSTSTAVWNPSVSAHLTDGAGLSSSAKMWIDGTSVAASWAYDIISEEWVGDGCDAHLETIYDYTKGTIAFQPTSLTDGTHTVRIQVANQAGSTLDYTWQFNVQAPPILSDHRPAPDTTVSSQSPTISLACAENSSVRSVVATVDGKAVSATYDSTTKRISVGLPGELANDIRHKATVTVDDTSGNRTTSSWAFTVQIYAEMPGAEATQCTSCHTDYPAQHPMSNCDACHGGDRPVGDCRPCHGYGGHGSDFIGTYCQGCHQPAYADKAPTHPTDNSYHVTSRDMTDCRPCHVSSLTIEHYRRKDASGNALTCESCHLSSDSKIKSAIATGDTDCQACHAAAVTHVEAHTEAALPADCAVCHRANIVTEHLSNTLTQSTAKNCDTCHASTDPKVDAAIADGDTSCDACHGTTDHLGAHASSIDDACVACHDRNLVPEHAKASSSSSAGGCASCHPTPRSTLGSSWSKGCVQAGCHAAGTTQAMHGGMSTAHKATSSAACAATGCHSDDLASIHTSATAVVEDTTVSGCNVCHGNGRSPKSATCTDCHTGQLHASATHTVSAPCAVSGCHLTDVSKIHAGPGCAVCHGAGKTPSLACEDCHEGHEHGTVSHIAADTCVKKCHAVDDLVKIHGYDCSTCHPTPASSVTTWDKTCEQSGCHVAPHSQLAGYARHQDMVRDYGVSPCGKCHADEDCTRCHYDDATAPVTTSDVRSAYDVTALIHLSATDASGETTTYYQVDGGPIRTGLRVLIDHSAIETHTLEYWSLDGARNAEVRHRAHFTISAGEKLPPTTSSDAAASYTGTATIMLAPADHSGYGIASTYYVLDGRTAVAGTKVVVGPPKSFSATHTLEFWSIDNVDNVESRKSVTFKVNAAADSTAPVTNSNAKTSYTGPAVIQLTPTDAGWGVSKTYYTIDGGGMYEGTTIAVSAPASGSATHTVEFWSTDLAGNVEARNTRTFTVTAGGTGTIRFLWYDAPSDWWFRYYIYDNYNGEKRLVASGYNTTGVWSAQVPVSPLPYQLEICFKCPDDPEPTWEYNSGVRITTAGAVWDWWY